MYTFLHTLYLSLICSLPHTPYNYKTCYVPRIVLNHTPNFSQIISYRYFPSDHSYHSTGYCIHPTNIVVTTNYTSPTYTISFSSNNHLYRITTSSFYELTTPYDIEYIDRISFKHTYPNPLR